MSVHGACAILVGGDGGFEIARVGEAVGADRAAFGQAEGAAVILADIAAGGAAEQVGRELHAARDDHDFAGLRLDHAEFGAEAQRAVLRHEQHFAVGVVENPRRPSTRWRDRDAPPCRLRASASPAVVTVRHALDQRLRRRRARHRAPAQRRDRQIGLRGTAPCAKGAASASEKRPMCAHWAGCDTANDRSLLARGAVNGEPLSCSAYRP